MDTLLVATEALRRRDPDLGAIVEQHGRPPLWSRPPGFATLLHIILEQQVSLASARAVVERLLARIGPPTPAAFLTLGDADLLAAGFSRQKARYGRLLAGAIDDGSFDLDGIASLPDDAARSALLAQTGIGPWTADIYLLMALGRPDVWPDGDLALLSSLAAVKSLPARPRVDEARRIAGSWRPWRSVAARLLWHDYLARRARREPPATAPRAGP
ncbi:MAG TPA: hypothetical protein VFK54_08905 [Candidatus Limnocylindrales bacterium]|nr:hypothetical protein [Candidatus Limnocylindrales bacterium]